MTGPIVVAGAGVAGLSAAITLARAGLVAHVIERRAEPGGHRASAWDAIEDWSTEEALPTWLDGLGLDRSRFELRPGHGFGVIDAHDQLHPVRSERPFFWLVRRGRAQGGLEAGLAAQARELGVTFEFGRTCGPEEADIRATGCSTRTPSFVTVGVSFEAAIPDLVLGLVDPRIAPDAYGYLIVVQGQGTLAVVLTDHFNAARRSLDLAIEAFGRHVDLRFDSVVHWGGKGGDAPAARANLWPGGQSLRAASRSRDIVVGEAAGYQDFLWGFGIRHAMWSGCLAARSIVEGTDFRSVAAREFRPMIRASLINRAVYQRLPRRMSSALVAHYSSQPDTRARIRRWYHPTRVHRAVELVAGGVLGL